MSDTNEELTEREEQLMASLARSKARQRKLREAVEQLRDAAVAQQQENSRLQAEGRELRQQRDELKQELEAAQEEAKAHLEQLKQHCIHQAELQRELDAASLRASSAERALDEARGAIAAEGLQLLSAAAQMASAARRASYATSGGPLSGGAAGVPWATSGDLLPSLAQATTAFPAPAFPAPAGGPLPPLAQMTTAAPAASQQLQRSGGLLPPLAIAATPSGPAAAPAASQQLQRSGSSGTWAASEMASDWSDGEEAVVPNLSPGGQGGGGLRSSGKPISGGIHKRHRSIAPTDAYAINHACANCGKVGKTPQTRRGPAGNATLCNACGSRLLKGTFLTDSAEACANKYPVDHNIRVVYWPGQKTRHCDMLARVEEVRAIATLVRDHGYRFFYNRGDSASKAERNLNAFIAHYGRSDALNEEAAAAGGGGQAAGGCSASRGGPLCRRSDAGQQRRMTVQQQKQQQQQLPPPPQQPRVPFSRGVLN